MRKKKEDAEKTREKILDAAIRVFSDKGFQLTSLEEIAKAADVTRGAIYWHFKNKAGIFDALHESFHAPLIATIAADLVKDHPNPLIQLRELCTNLLLNLENDTRQQQVLNLFLVRCDYSGELAFYKQKHAALKADTTKLFSQYLKKAKEKGLLDKDLNPDLLTIALDCYLMGIVIEYLKYPDALNLKDSGAALIQFFFRRLEI